jgi:putative ABC transport system permease protein
MNALESLRISWRNVREHTLRSTLTTLGVIIGVAAVITFVTLGASLQAEIVETVAGGNVATMYVTASGSDDGQLPDFASGGRAVFTEHDVEQMRQIRGVGAVVPQSGFPASAIAYENDSVARQWVTVTTPEYFDVRGQEFVEGRPFRVGTREVVLNEPASQLFEDGNISVGDQLTMTKAATGRDVNVTVVGIVKAAREDSDLFLSGGPQPMVYAPAEPFYQRTALSPAADENQRVYGRLIVVAEDPGNVDAVQGRVYTYLGERSDAKVLKPRGYEFRVTTQDELVQQVKQVSSTFTAYISGIALISLIVGSIGIANIMLVSVTERTREIGIMKAVGAQNRDVLQLFLVEATILGVLGATLGAVVGVAAAYAATEVIGLPLTFRPEWFLASVLVGVLVGVMAGLYPAWDASTVDPIEALRYE